MRTCLSIRWERFRGTQKEDGRGFPRSQSSLGVPMDAPLQGGMIPRTSSSALLGNDYQGRCSSLWSLCFILSRTGCTQTLTHHLIYTERLRFSVFCQRRVYNIFTVYYLWEEMCVLYKELCPPVPEYRQVKCTVWCLLEVCVQWEKWCFPVPAYTRSVKCTAQYGVYWQCAYSRRSCALLYLDTGR